MKFSEYKYLIFSDLYRIKGERKLSALLWSILLGEAYKYIFWMRTCRYTRAHRLLKYAVYPIARIVLYRLTYKFGISIPPATQIGSGFYIGHFGGIIVNGYSIIGKNCNISQGVTIGQSSRGKNQGYPVLGDNVFIGPGAKILGAVCVGNDVAIGANCVVTRDIPDHSVVVGIPGQVISHAGSAVYVDNTDYDKETGL